MASNIFDRIVNTPLFLLTLEVACGQLFASSITSTVFGPINLLGRMFDTLYVLFLLIQTWNCLSWISVHSESDLTSQEY